MVERSHRQLKDALRSRLAGVSWFYHLPWVLWHKQNLNREDKEDKFDWKSAAHHLHVPMLAILFEQIAAPSKLKSLGLVSSRAKLISWLG